MPEHPFLDDDAPITMVPGALRRVLASGASMFGGSINQLLQGNVLSSLPTAVTGTYGALSQVIDAANAGTVGSPLPLGHLPGGDAARQAAEAHTQEVQDQFHVPPASNTLETLEESLPMALMPGSLVTRVGLTAANTAVSDVQRDLMSPEGQYHGVLHAFLDPSTDEEAVLASQSQSQGEHGTLVHSSVPVDSINTSTDGQQNAAERRNNVTNPPSDSATASVPVSATQFLQPDPIGDFLTRVQGPESNGNPHAVNPSPSRAAGLFQFIQQTWDGLPRAVRGDAPSADRASVSDQWSAARYLAERNDAAFSQQFGRDPSHLERYGMWFTGNPGMAVQLVNSPPNTPMSAVIGSRAAHENASIPTTGAWVRIAQQFMGSANASEPVEDPFLRETNTATVTPAEQFLSNSVPAHPFLGTVVPRSAQSSLWEQIRTGVGTPEGREIIGAVGTLLALGIGAHVATRYSANSVVRNSATMGVPVEGVNPSGAVSGRLNAVENTLVDRTATLRGAIRDNPVISTQAAREYEATVYNGLNNLANITHSQNVYTTGRLPESSLRLSEPVSVLDGLVSRLSREDQTVLHDGLWSADELDNRVRLSQRPNPQVQGIGANPATAGGTSSYRNFGGRTDQQLRDAVTLMESRPALDAIKDLYRDNMRQFGEWTVEQGRLTQVELDQVQRQHPNYVPEPTSRNTVEALGLRHVELGSGHEVMPMTPFDAMRAYIPSLIEDVLTNTARRTAVDALRGTDLITPEHVDTAGPRSLVYRDASGQAVGVRINDPVIYATLKNTPSLQGALIDTINRGRHYVQSGATGPLSLLGGSFFAPSSAIMGATVGSATRPVGTRFGLLGFRGDPTAAPLALLRGTKDWSALTAQSVRNIAETHMLADTWMARHYPQSVQWIADRAGAYFDASHMADVMHAGLGGPAVRTAGIDGLDRVRMLGNADSHKVSRYIATTLDVIGNSPASLFYRQNPRLSPAVRAFNARRLAGDPGAVPGSATLRGINSVVPYANISMQGIAQVVRAFRNAPVGVSTGIAMTALTSALVTAISAINAGPEAVRHAAGGVDDRDAAGFTHVYLPGADPSTAVRIPLPYELRPFTAIARAMLLSQLGFYDGSVMDPYHEMTRDMLDRVISQGVRSNVLSSLGQMVPIQPYALNAVEGARAALAGDVPRSVDLSPDSMASRAYTGGSSMLPGSERNTSAITGTVSGLGIEQMIRSTLSVLGSTVISMLSAVNGGMRQGVPISDSLSRGIEAWQQSARDRMPYIPWGMAARESTSTPLNEVVNTELTAMRNISGVASDVTRPGLVGSGMNMQRQETPGGGHMNREMIPIVMTVQRFQSVIDQAFGVRRNVILQQIQQNARFAAPDAARMLNNQRAEELRDINERILGLVGRMESALAQQVGHPVDLRRVDVTRGMEQFQ